MITAEEQLLRGVPVKASDCICCQQAFAQADEFCRQCQAPTSLSHTVAQRDRRPNFVSVLGASNAGKTVYLGLLLDILSKGANGFRGTPSNATSIDLQEQVITALEQRSFPDKTPSEADAWKWMHCEVSMAKKKGFNKVDLISPDFAGEAIGMEIQRAGSFPAIQQVVRQSAGLMILCDSMRVRDEGSGEDLFAMKLASYIAERHGLTNDRSFGRNRLPGPAIAIVFTKCDGCVEAMEDAQAFAANNTPRLFEYCRRTFPHHEYFAASVAGSSGMLADSRGRKMQVPFHIQPRGIVEPLQWIVSRSS